MIKVNLVPTEILAKGRQRQLVLQAAVVGGLLALVLVLVSLGHWFGLLRLESDFSYKESKLKKLSAIVAQVEELEKAGAAVRARLGVIEDLLKGRSFYPIFMSEFARSVPAGVRVTQLNTTTVGNNGLKLTVSATAATNEDVAAWIKALEAHSHFAGVELGIVSASGPNSRTFSVVASYTIKL
ncbi:MAG: PilN domain-containing protein [Elusimicrobiota bacterium]